MPEPGRPTGISEGGGIIRNGGGMVGVALWEGKRCAKGEQGRDMYRPLSGGSPTQAPPFRSGMESDVLGEGVRGFFWVGLCVDFLGWVCAWIDLGCIWRGLIWVGLCVD